MENSKSSCGLNDYCYRTGYNHGFSKGTGDAISDGIEAFPCTTNAEANDHYARGFHEGISHGNNFYRDAYYQSEETKASHRSLDSKR